jgi:methylmalonyl-CoA/ethylmalonyl-CoA epimerase
MAVDIFARFATGYKAYFIGIFRRFRPGRMVGFRAMMLPRPRRAVWTSAAVLFVGVCASAAAQPAPDPLQLKPHHATAAVADIDRAVRWYQDVLGFKVVNRGDRPNGTRFADLEIPGFGIGLVQSPGASSPSTNAARSGWVHIVFSVPEPARAYALLKARGADVSTRGNTPPADVTTFLVHDSEGNEIEIVAER